jgi:hypothetical protein
MSKYLAIYTRLFLEFGYREFSISMASKIGKMGFKTPLAIVLNRMCDKGLLERVSRGKYRVIHPLSILLEQAGFRWRDKVDIKYHAIIDFLLSRLIVYFNENLVSIIIFGSVARGEAREYSDIDILVVIDGAPSKYSDRIKLIRSFIGGLEKLRIDIWQKYGVYPLIDIIMLDKSETYINHPFYLDLIHDGIIVYDKEDFMKNRINELKLKLKELGSRRIELPDGRYYWVLKPDLRWGEVIDI